MTSLIWRWWHTQFFSPYIHSPRYKTNQEGTIHLPTTKTDQYSFYLIWLVYIFFVIFIVCILFSCAVRLVVLFFDTVTTDIIYRTSCTSHIRSGGGVLIAERISNFCLARELIWLLWSRLIFSPNEDDLSHSTRTTFPGNIKGGENARTLSSSLILAADRITMRSEHLIYGPLCLGNQSFIIRSTLLDQRFPEALNWLFNSPSDIISIPSLISVTTL